MAYPFTYCTGKTGKESGNFSGLAPEMTELSELLRKRFGNENLAKGLSEFEWLSPPRISCFDRLACGGVDWAVMSRTRPVSDAESGNYKEGFVTEIVACKPDEVRNLSQLRITPADILLAPGRAGLWYDGERWTPPILRGAKPIPLLDAVNPERNRVSPRRIEPPFWPQLAPGLEDAKSAALFPFQFPHCCWLADRDREVSVGGSGDAGNRMALAPDGLLVLFNESSRAMAEWGEEKHSGLRADWWMEVPWRVSFTTFALDRDRPGGRCWIGCWRRVSGHERFVSEARSEKCLLDLDRLEKFKLERIKSAGWIPPERVIETEPRRGEQPLGSKEIQEPEEPPPVSRFRAGIAAVALLAVLYVFVVDPYVTRWLEGERKIAAIEAYTEEIDETIRQCDAALENGDSADYEMLAEVVPVLQDLLQGEFEKSDRLASHASILHGLVIGEEDGQIIVGNEDETDSKRVEEAILRLQDALNLANAEHPAYEEIGKDAKNWRERLETWDLSNRVDPGSIPDSLGRNPRANDQRGLLAAVEVANRVAAAKERGDLVSKTGIGWEEEMRIARETTGPFFGAAIESIEQKAGRIVKERFPEEPAPSAPPPPPPGDSGLAAMLILPRSQDGNALVYDLPLAEGFELKWIRYVAGIDGEGLSLVKAPSGESESFAVTIPGGTDQGQSWEELESVPGTGVILNKSSRVRIGDLEQAGGGAPSFSMAPGNFKTEYAILQAVPGTDREKDAQQFFLCRASPFAFASVPADRFFRGEEAGPSEGRLRIDLGDRAHKWELEGSIQGTTVETGISRLAEVRGCFEKMVNDSKKKEDRVNQLEEAAEDFASAVKAFEEFFLSTEPNRISGTGWEGEPDLFSGVKRLTIKRREEVTEDQSGNAKRRTIPQLVFAGSSLEPLTYTFRDYLFGEGEPLEGGRRKKNFSTFREALWSYGALSLGKFVEYSSTEADYSGGTPNEEMTNLFHNPESEKDALKEQYRQVERSPLNFALFDGFFPGQTTFPGMEELERETARVQNGLRFQHQWGEFTRRLNDPQIQRFFEWESMVTGKNGPAISDPDEHFDRFFASGSPPPVSATSSPSGASPISAIDLEAAMKNLGPKLNEWVKIGKLELVQDKKE